MSRLTSLSLPLLAAGTLLALANHAPAQSKPAPAPRTEESALTPTMKDENRHKDFLKRIHAGPIGLLFLGDSITDIWPSRSKDTWNQWAKYHPADFGVSGDRTEHLIWRITNGELDGIHPKVTVILIGTNNIGHFADEKPEWAAAGVKKVIDIVKEKLPRTQIILIGVFPRGTKDSSQRQGVATINQIISKFDDGKTVHYIDFGDKFLDTEGNIPADLMPDALHPSDKGFGIWFESIKPLVDELYKSN